MKLFILLQLFIVVVYSTIIHEKENALKNEIEDLIPTATTIKESTKVYKRALTTQYIEKGTITIFKEGSDKWNSNWDSSLSRDIKNGPIVVDGVIQVDIKVDGGLLLEDINLVSGYGIVTFDYKIETPENKEVELHLYTFDGDAFVKLNSYIYPNNGEYVTISQPVMNYEKNSYIRRITRFIWCNYNNQRTYTLYLKNIVYRNIKVEVPFSLIDMDTCALSSSWLDASTNTENTKFDSSGGDCTMVINSSRDDPVVFKLNDDLYFGGGRIETELKSLKENTYLNYYFFNTKNKTNSKIDTYEVKTTNQKYISKDFEFNNNQFNALKIYPNEEKSQFEITLFVLYPQDLITYYEVVELGKKPVVIIGKNGLYWKEASWGDTFCNFNSANSEIECSLSGSWPAFSFINPALKISGGGTLAIIMKAKKSYKPTQIQVYYTDGNYINLSVFFASEKYEIFKFYIEPRNKLAINRFAIQEASLSANQDGNIYYIKKVVFIPDGIEFTDDYIELIDKDELEVIDPGVIDPAVTNEEKENYEITRLDKPEIILDKNGLSWTEDNSNSTNCNFSTSIGEMTCTVNDDELPYFGFKKETYKLNGGTLIVNMRSLDPTKSIRIKIYYIDGNFLNVDLFEADTEYKYYIFNIPSYHSLPFYKFAIQDDSRHGNTFYIKEIIYYPRNIEVPNDKYKNEISGSCSSFTTNNILVIFFVTIIILLTS